MIARTAAAVAAFLLASPATRAAPAADRDAKARAYFTNAELVDQEGRTRRFYDDVLRGNVVLMAFVFTRCPDACPLITQKMNGVRRELGERFGREVRFVSMSVDPAFDSPAELRKFAERQAAVHGAWTFLTGDEDAVAGVLRRLGQAVGDPSDHFTGFIAANVRTGHWMKVRPDVPAPGVAEMLRGLAAEDASAPVAAKSP